MDCVHVAMRLGWLTGLAALLAGDAFAAVNLELRPVTEPCYGQELAVDLYAVAAPGEAFSALDVILTWDPGRLLLLRRENVGPSAWLSSGFPPDSGLDGLNETFTDGDALYSAYSRFGTPARATPIGLLVTRFVFRKLLVGPPATDVNMSASRGFVHGYGRLLGHHSRTNHHRHADECPAHARRWR